MADQPTGNDAPTVVTSGAPATQTVEAPKPIDVADDTLISIKGQEKPVKFGEHVRGFQSQFTKATQELARYKAALQERDQKIKAFQDAQKRTTQPQQPDPLSQLGEKPYLTGQEAADMVNQFRGELQRRDQIVVAALRELVAMKQVLGGLHDNHTNSAFDAKINKWLTDGGYPAEAADFAKELYLAYEPGNGLDEEFPTILKTRWEQLNKVVEASRQAKLRAARQPAFVPGRGGEARPSKQLEIKPEATSKDIAELLWNKGWDETDT